MKLICRATHVIKPNGFDVARRRRAIRLHLVDYTWSEGYRKFWTFSVYAVRGRNSLTPSVNNFTPVYEFTYHLHPPVPPTPLSSRLAGTPPQVDQELVMVDLKTLLDPLAATVHLSPAMDSIYRLVQDVELTMNHSQRGGNIQALRKHIRAVAYTGTVRLDLLNG